MKALMLILDGLGDYPCKALKGKTPLEASNARNMQKMGKEGETGFLTTIGYGIPPGSDTAHLALFGYNPKDTYVGRGVYEALGAGIDLKKGDIAFRVNFATTKRNRIIDRRAGRNDLGLSEVSDELDGMKIGETKITFKHTVEHRAVLVLRGKGLSKDVSDTDPHKVGVPTQNPKPTRQTPEAKRTARILEKFLDEVKDILEKNPINRKREKKGIPRANAILLRGAGRMKTVMPFKKLWGVSGSAIAGGALYKGVARFVGLDIIKVPGATGDKNTNLEAKAEAAIEAKSNFVFLHVKATDSFSHDKDPIGKARFIKAIDTRLVSKLKNNFDIIFISGDHSTPCNIGDHTADPVPMLLYGDGITRRDEGGFSESKAGSGIYRLRGLDVTRTILSKIGKVGKYGE